MLRANNKPEALNAMIERNVLRRIGKADEIASVVAFLATHDAGFLTDEAVMHLVVCPATGFATMPTSGAFLLVPHMLGNVGSPKRQRALRLDAENRPKCPEADLASGSWVEIVHRRTRAKRFRIRSEPAPY